MGVRPDPCALLSRSTMPRPTKLTREVVDRIVMLIRAGNYLETAAAAAGVDRVTLFRWLRRGTTDDGTELEHELSYGVIKASAEAEARDVALIAKAASEDWRAAAWRLEKRHQDRWGGKRAPEPLPHDETPKLPPPGWIVDGEGESED